MFGTALVALDLSPADRPILDCLPGLRRWGVDRIVLCHVITLGYGQGASLGKEDEFVAWLERCAAPLRAEGLEVTIALRASGTPAAELLAAARENGADLLLVGSRARSMARSLFLGSIAREVIRQATLPVLLQWLEPVADAPAARCEAVCRDSLAHVLLATDLSKHASRAEAAAIALAGRAGRTDCLTVLTDAAREATPALPIMARAALEALLERIRAAGGQGEALVAEGEAAARIAEIAAARGCTLIIVGKQGRGWMRSKLFGGTAARLCETARRPVLMVPLG
jgi:nucleotide-binding universal stress UspA family protein